MLALLAASAGLWIPAQTKLQLVIGVSAGALPAELLPLLSAKTLEELSEKAEGKGVTIRHYRSEQSAIFVVGDPFALAARRKRAALAEHLSGAAAGSPIALDNITGEAKQALHAFLELELGQLYRVRPTALEKASVAVGTTWVVTLEHAGKQHTTGLSGGQADSAILDAVRSEPLPEAVAGEPRLPYRPGYPASNVSFTVAEYATAVARRVRATGLYLAEVEKDASASFERFERASETIEKSSKLRSPREGDGFAELDIQHQRVLMDGWSQHFKHYGFDSPEAAATWMSSTKQASVIRQIHIRVKVQMPDGSFEGFQTTILP